MSAPQPGILSPVPSHARFLEFVALPDCDTHAVLRDLAALSDCQNLVVGFGSGLIRTVGGTIAALHAFPAMSGTGCEVPSTQADIWCWVTGEDRGEVLHQGRQFAAAVSAAFRCVRAVDGFRYKSGLDLTGYEDGTENPEGEDAVEAAILQSAGPGLDGSSFVAVQQWLHDLDHFETLPREDTDNIIGRRLSDNVEFDGSPESAHVKRTAQESFEPEAFVLRRSMPWADDNGAGLYFTAFGKSFAAFEAQLKRMTGQEDGVVDGLFRFTRPITGGYYWCPPQVDGSLDLSALEI
ncbi:Dyp-type peroxidase [Pelagibius sp. Alg239-R121]|uniref:Dyp-type peroxidase n=1 Tax=Pelagibius sp. Alg239-R121 TaxID=2993448 RepID=UPI0024A77423|nr:Dyp-type peroxidase [Pelagibius sp. Alg239-R121]